MFLWEVKKSLLHEMFLDKNRPFYKSVKHFKIEKIQKESWLAFIQSKFAQTVEKNGQNLYDEQFLAKFKIKTGSIQTALKGLLKKDLLDKNAQGYYFQDPLLEHWIKFKMIY